MTDTPHKFSKPKSDRADEKAVRPCLKCGQEFLSEWKGNRRCKVCRDSLHDHRVYTTPQHEGCALP